MEKSNKYNDLSMIAASLKYGKFYGESRKKIVGVYAALVTIFGLGMILSITMLSIEQVNDPGSITLFVGAIISCILGLSFLPLIWLIIIIKNEKIRNKILVWLEDAIELQAYAKKIGSKNWLGCVPLIKLQIDFNIEGVHFTRSSEQVDKGQSAGYLPLLSNYADKKINILYSKKYDEVLILKV